MSQIDIGSDFLNISKIKMLRGSQQNEVVRMKFKFFKLIKIISVKIGEALLTYGGGFTITVTTKIYVKNLVTVPVKLTIAVKSISGKVTFLFFLILFFRVYSLFFFPLM